MTPEELARMQPGLNPYSYYGQDLNEQLRAGQIPTGRPKVPAAQQAKQFAGATLQNMMASMGQMGTGFTSIPTGRLGLAGGIIPGVTTALTELGEGRPVGAAGAIFGAGTGGLLGAGAARFIPSTGRFGLLGKAAQVALPFLGAQFGAQQGAAAAEYGRQSVTKIPTKGKEAEIASQLALAEKQAELGMTQFRNNLGVETGAMKDLSQFYSNLEYQNTLRNLPIVNQMKNAEAVRMQSLIASQGNQLARLNILNTAGNLAQGAQSQGGETLRTMLTSNPYANAVLRP